MLQGVVKIGIVGALAGGFLLANATQSVQVIIENYRFTPQTVRIKVGDTVRWTNGERRASHSIFFTGREGTESDRLFPGEAWMRTFLNPGVYSYTCGPHPEMTGQVIVTD